MSLPNPKTKVELQSMLEGTAVLCSDKHVLSGTIPGLLEALRDEQNQSPL